MLISDKGKNDLIVNLGVQGIRGEVQARFVRLVCANCDVMVDGEGEWEDSKWEKGDEIHDLPR